MGLVWMKSYWKPIRFVSKGTYVPIQDHWPKAGVDGDGMNKGSHEFQQGVNESQYLIDKFTYEGNWRWTLSLVPEPTL